MGKLAIFHIRPNHIIQPFAVICGTPGSRYMKIEALAKFAKVGFDKTGSQGVRRFTQKSSDGVVGQQSSNGSLNFRAKID
jgi:hypothetical protein